LEKNGNGFWRKAATVTGILLALAGAVFGYGLLCGNVNSNTKDIAEMKPEVHKIERMEYQLDYIIKGVDEIKAELKEQ